MGMPEAAAGGASVAALGLKAYGDVLKGQGEQAGDIYRAQSLENAAQRGRVAAIQTGAAESIKIASDLGNVDAIRAASHADPTSPTGAAVRDWHEQLGLTKKAIDIDNILAQAQQQEADAAYLRTAGKAALQAGYVAAGADVASGLAKAL